MASVAAGATKSQDISLKNNLDRTSKAVPIEPNYTSHLKEQDLEKGQKPTEVDSTMVGGPLTVDYVNNEEKSVAAASTAGPPLLTKVTDGPSGSQPPQDDPFLVTITGREHLNPHTWGVMYRWSLTTFGAFMVVNATFASTGPSQLIPSIDEYFHVAEEVGLLFISLFLCGYCLGPLFWVSQSSTSTVASD